MALHPWTRGYWYNLLSWLSQGLNAILGGNRDQTLSSRIYEAAVVAERHHWWPVMVALDWFWCVVDQLLRKPKPELDHCAWAYTQDTERTYTARGPDGDFA